MRAPCRRQRILGQDAEPGELMLGTRRVAAGEAALSPSGVRRVIDELATVAWRR
jgi:hypothetical protein